MSIGGKGNRQRDWYGMKWEYQEKDRRKKKSGGDGMKWEYEYRRKGQRGWDGMKWECQEEDRRKKKGERDGMKWEDEEDDTRKGEVTG